VNTYEKKMMLNAHELYVLAENHGLPAASASTTKRSLRYRTRPTGPRMDDKTAAGNWLSIDYVAVLGEN